MKTVTKIEEDRNPIIMKQEHMDATLESVEPFHKSNRASIKLESGHNDAKNILLLSARRSMRLTNPTDIGDPKPVISHRSGDVALNDWQVSEPDIYEPNNLCKLCGKILCSRQSYQRHLQSIHKVVLPLLNRQPQRNVEITPDERDPNNHCKSCERTFACLENYRRHLKLIHKWTITENSSLPKTKPKNRYVGSSKYCKLCKRTFNLSQNYRRHLQIVHKLKLTNSRPRNKPNFKIMPDERDPNTYCKSCQKNSHQ